MYEDDIRDPISKKPTGQTKWVVDRKGFKFACWLFKLTKRRERLDALDWVYACIEAANEGRTLALDGPRDTTSPEYVEAQERAAAMRERMRLRKERREAASRG
jgi:hypothetical protein